MKAWVYEGPERLSLRDWPAPVAGQGELSVTVDAVGICGSDMHAYFGHDERRPAPIVLGHEIAGRIAGGPRAGERVAVNPLVECGECEACRAGRANICPGREILSMPPRQGGFAETVVAPERNLIAVPDDVSDITASLVEPMACAWHAAKLGERLIDRPLGEAASLVIGGGAIGLGAALSLRVRGAGPVHVAELHPGRRDLLAGIGGFTVSDGPGEMAPDLVIDAHGNAATRALASAAVKPGGAIVHIGLAGGEGGIDARRLTLQEIVFAGSYTYTPDDFRETAQALFTGRFGSLGWVEEQPFAAGAGAFARLAAGEVAAPKIVLSLGGAGV